MGRADSYSQPEAPDPILPDALVLELARAHLPRSVQVQEVVEVDESGGEARVYVLGGGVVVKTQRPHRLRPRTGLVKEAAILTALAGPLRGRIPVVFGYQQTDTDVGPVELIVMSQVAGSAARNRHLVEAARADVLHDVATVLRAVHALDPGGLQRAGLLPTDGDAAALRRRVERNLGDLIDHFDAQPEAWSLSISPAQVAAAAVDSLPARLSTRPVVLHSNPGPTHVFVGEDCAFTGLIDFGDAYASHPTLDLKSWPDPEDRVLLRGAYLAGDAADTEFDAVWTVAMLQADMNAIATQSPEVAGRAGADLTARLHRL